MRLKRHFAFFRNIRKDLLLEYSTKNISKAYDLMLLEYNPFLSDFPKENRSNTSRWVYEILVKPPCELTLCDMVHTSSAENETNCIMMNIMEKTNPAQKKN